MKPPPFDYAAPATLDEALDLLAEHGDEAKPLAGGQSLIPVLNFRLARPSVLIDLAGIPELRELHASNGSLRMGAMVRQRDAERSPEVAARAPLLAEALPHVAHPQIRNRGTIGGSLAHADPAAELPAVALALGARFRLCRAGQERWIGADDFFTGLFTTALSSDELLVEIEISAVRGTAGWAFEEVARRHGDFALVGIAAMVEMDGSGTCRAARLAYVGAGPGPVRAPRAEALLAGQRPTDEVIRAAAELAPEELRPPADVHASADFRRHLAGVITRRALRRAYDRVAATP